MSDRQAAWLLVFENVLKVKSLEKIWQKFEKK